MKNKTFNIQSLREISLQAEKCDINKFLLNSNLLFLRRFIVRLDNLYNGDKVLGDSTNLFLNENWEEIFNELKLSIFDAFGLIVSNLINQVFRKIPYNELFSNQS